MADARFKWKRCGRQMVCRFGRLDISVRSKGSVLGGDKQWCVGYVFGNAFLGTGTGWTTLEKAINETEMLALREMRALATFIDEYDDK